MFVTTGSRATRKRLSSGGGGTPAAPTGSVQFNNSNAFGGFGFWDGSATLSLGSSNTAQAFRVYNTVDNSSSPTNFERAVFDWTTNTNTLTIGTQAGGTGSPRSILIQASTASGANVTLQTGTNGGFIAFNLGSNGTHAAVTGSGNLFGFCVQSADAIGWGGSPTGNSDTGLTKSAIQVINFNRGATEGSNTAATGWMQWGGQQRVTSDFSRSNSTAATAITGISSIALSPPTGVRNYKFEAWLATAGSTAGGISIAITCTSSTITSLAVDGFILDSNVVRGQQGVITSTTTPVVNSSAITSSAPTVRIQGLIRASSGTFGLSLAQSTANATAVVVSSGSWLEVHDVP